MGILVVLVVVKGWSCEGCKRRKGMGEQEKMGKDKETCEAIISGRVVAFSSGGCVCVFLFLFFL